jgi:hypothetical protein
VESQRDIETRLAAAERQTAENRHEIANARQVIEIRLTQLGTNIQELRGALKWAGGLIISLMLSFMGWAALQQYNANEQQKKDLETQVQLLEREDKAANDRDRILRELRDAGITATDRDDASIIRDDKSDDQDPNERQ